MGQPELEFAIQAAIREAHLREHEFVTVEHLLYALLFEPVAREVLEQCGADPVAMQLDLEAYFEKEIPRLVKVKGREPRQTVGFRRVLERAVIQVQASEREEEINGADVLVSIREEKDSHAAWLLDKHGVGRMELLECISHGSFGAHRKRTAQPAGDGREAHPESPQTAVKKYVVNLTGLAREGKLDPLVGRERELRRMQQVLCRRTKNNPVLVGEAGVGKSAIVEGFAQAVADGKVADTLEGSEVLALDLAAMVAGTKYRGQFEERMKSVLDALKKMGQVILFIDEIHMIAGAGAATGNSMDAANLLKPFLQRGDLRCIGATTYEDFRTLEKDRALVRRLQKIDVAPSSVDETVVILEGLQDRFEAHHSVHYEREALSAAAELSDRFLHERWLPDKAIDLLDEAGAENRLNPPGSRKETLGRTDIVSVLAKVANIPDLEAGRSEKDRLATLETDLRKVVFGQDEAIKAVCEAVKLSRAGLTAHDQPVGAFLFVGPSGVGKTELARQLASILGIAFLRFDMSEFMEKHAVSRLIGAPPGYVGFEQGGLLTAAVRKTPSCVLLLDEIEKAHPDLFDILLQVMDHAALTDHNGRTSDFRNVVLAMTSNAGTRDFSSRGIGFREERRQGEVQKEVERLFSPEFRNRLTGVVRFSALSPSVAASIVDKFVGQLEERLKPRGIALAITPSARAWFADRGVDPVYGARPLRRLIHDELHLRLAEEILFGRLSENGGRVTVELTEKGGIALSIATGGESGAGPAPAAGGADPAGKN